MSNSIFFGEQLFHYFEEISAIPRSSGNESAIADYLASFAVQHELQCYRDDINNIIIKKPASAGSENAPTVILQGHTDMVCEKDENSDHNFSCDGIKLVVKDGFISAEGTTLGADNGIAVALMLKILSDNSIVHPPLECVFTTQEETGLTGASRLSAGKLTGRIMINLDSEEEGVATVSCAGGMRVRFYKDPQWEDTDKKGILIKISGLAGGHSGMDIGLERGNANKLMGRVLEHIAEERIPFNIAAINGGGKDNSIPRECSCVIVLHSETDYDKVIHIINSDCADIKTELYQADSDFNITVSDAYPKRMMSERVTGSLIALIYLTPDGVLKRNPELNNFVAASLNMGIISTVGNGIAITISARSSIAAFQQNIRRRLALFAGHFGFAMQIDSSYPGWEYAPNSHIRDVFLRCYQQLSGKQMRIEALHAGLECGIFAEKLDGLDVIAVGPNIYDCHTPNERLEISSCERFYNLLIHVLAELG